mmetsp:Transcript_36481/g.97152  ORF Transcript_36481/g.97152 Transcript_36481/m.97152 type:complete len:206 (-) Transcript_36481:664-1281(-)
MVTHEPCHAPRRAWVWMCQSHHMATQDERESSSMPTSAWYFLICIAKFSLSCSSVKSFSLSNSKTNLSDATVSFSLSRISLSNLCSNAVVTDIRFFGSNSNICAMMSMESSSTCANLPRKPSPFCFSKHRMYFLDSGLSNISISCSDGMPIILKILMSMSDLPCAWNFESRACRLSGDNGKHEEPGNSGPLSMTCVPSSMPSSSA